MSLLIGLCGCELPSNPVGVNKTGISYSYLPSKTQKDQWAMDDSMFVFYCWTWVIPQI